jgi:hypothetical protein
MNKTARNILYATLFLLLTACGGGGGGGGSSSPTATSISGTAAAGAPIIGTVTIKDSSTPFKTKTVTIAADGKYTIDVTGMTAPFMMRADGTVGGNSYSLYSAAVSTDVGGNINITPLTDLIVANIAGQIASTYFSSGNFSALTATDLAAQETALQARLQPILTAVGLGSSLDLLRASFSTNHSGLDAALDVLRVTVDPNTAVATITNVIDNQQITDNLASQTDNSIITATNVGTGLTEFQQIVTTFSAFTSLFATGLPAVNNATLVAAIDSTFLGDGEDKAAFLSLVSSESVLVGSKFTVTSLVPASLLPSDAPTAATVNVALTAANGVLLENFEWAMKKSGGVWRIAGNGRIAEAKVETFARLQDVYINNVLQTNYIDTGLQFSVHAPSPAGLAAIGANPPNGSGYYAVITGPGLPVAGALCVSSIQNDSCYAAAGAPGTYIGSTTPALNTYGHSQYPLNDTTIGALPDNVTYTVKIYHDNATINSGATNDDVLLATYTSSPGKRPFLKSELTVASFAAITTPAKTALNTFGTAGGTMNVTWTLPSGTTSSGLHYFRSGSTGFDSTGVDLTSTAISGQITSPPLASANIGTLQSNGINLWIVDTFNRSLTTIFNGQ